MMPCDGTAHIPHSQLFRQHSDACSLALEHPYNHRAGRIPATYTGETPGHCFQRFAATVLTEFSAILL